MGHSKVHPFLELIRTRASVETFDPQSELSEEEIRDLVEDATLAPSSFNIQHWRFIAVRREADKKRLQAAAYGQQQVADAAVTFIVLGDLSGVEKLPAVLDLAVKRGVLPRAKATAWIRMAKQIYADEGMARDEALRSGSLAAMILMLAAEARGLASGALSGFDVEQVKREFGVEDRYVPVMLLAVGRPVGAPTASQPRLPVEEVLAFDHGRTF